MRQVTDNSARTKMQLKPNTRLPHLTVKARTTQAMITQTIYRGTRTIEQEAHDRSIDHESMLRHAMMATYSDVSHLAATRPKTAIGLLRGYAAV